MDMEIPYTVHARPDTGLYNGKLGIWLFLASEVMLFGALFSALILLRTSDPKWLTPEQAGLNVWLAMFNTFVLILSSVTVVLAWANLRLGDGKWAKIWLAVTLLCGAIFMVVKGFEYAAKFSHGNFPGTHNFFATYFMITGLHGLHVLGGMIVFAYFIGPGWRLWKQHPEQFTNRVEVTGLYWHFVDLVWIFLFPTLYLL